MSKWLNDFLGAHQPWQRAVWTVIAIVVGSVPVAALHVPAAVGVVVAALFTYLRAVAVKKGLVGALLT